MYRYSYVTQADNEMEQHLPLSNSDKLLGIQYVSGKGGKKNCTPSLDFLFFLLELEVHFEKVSKDASTGINQWEQASAKCLPNSGPASFQVGMYNSSGFNKNTE